jgi:DNA-directed RNA polymerase subunit RPC12/RpoP
MESKNVKTINFQDLILECVDCGRNFTFTKGEQIYFASKGLSTPRRCPECRLKRRLSLVAEVNNNG